MREWWIRIREIILDLEVKERNGEKSRGQQSRGERRGERRGDLIEVEVEVEVEVDLPTYQKERENRVE